jgi:four helix bundle protein
METITLSPKMSLSGISEFSKMAVWEGGYNLCLEICRVADDAEDKNDVMVQRLKSTAASIPLDLSKSGSYRLGKQYVRFLRSAFVSTKQLATLLMICHDLRYIQTEKFLDLNSKINIYSSKLLKYIKFCEKKRRERSGKKS